MHRIRIYLGSECLLFSACIDPFYPNLGSQTTANVDGQITDQEGYQTVSISISFTIKDTDNKPLSNCKVKITDNKGNVFNLVEFRKGNYAGWVEKQYLIPGNSYQVDVITSTGIEILSDFDQMSKCPEIDSIYYIRENIATTNPSNPRQGIQFYIDLDGENTNSDYYRWNITETGEHHAVYPKTWYWTGRKMIQYYPPDYSLFYCWTPKSVPTIYTLSTLDLAQNSYRRYKLHFVDNKTQRLTYCYSILVNQCAISEAAHTFWDKLRINSNEQGGLYEIQPLHFKGNLKNTTNQELDVLVFFSAMSVRTKRLIIRDVENL